MAKLVCPHCGACTSLSPVWFMGKGRLLERGDADHPIYEDVALIALTDQEYMTVKGAVHYAVLECQSCNNWFVAAKEKYGGEWSAVYPVPHMSVAEEIPEPIKSEFEEAQLCFAVGAYRGCLLVCRTALIDMQREQKISGLDELVSKGIISATLLGQAHEVRLWANIIGHELVLPEEIEKDDVEHLLDYLRIILDTVYVQPKRLSALSQKRGQRKKPSSPPEPS